MPYFINQDGYEIYYEQLNPNSKKCTLILLHGFASSVSFFKEQIKVLKEHYRIICFDALGHGKSEHPKELNLSKNIRHEIIRDLEGLLDYLDIEGPYGIVGHSLVGGMIGQLICKKHPEDVKFLILLNSGYINTDNVLRNIFYNLLPYMIRINFLDVIDNSIVDILDNTKPYIVQALSNSLYDVHLSKDEIQMHIEEQIFGMVTEIQEYNPNYIKCPTLIVGGRLDNFAPEQMAEELHYKIPHSKLKIIDFAGHFGPAQRSEKYNQIILKFIKSIQ